MTYEFDRFLRYDELVAWLHEVADAHPELVTLETYGTSHEGRDLWLVTVTDSATGAHDTKPAHWVDASIHAVELTATVAACYLVHRLVTGYADGDETVVRALRTRTFYVVPRVNPDGAEWVLADQPKFRRSSTRPWPWSDAHQWPGLHVEDVDGDGRILSIRIADPNGAWMPHPDDARLMVPVPPTGAPSSTSTYRMLTEGSVAGYDGFTIPTPRAGRGARPQPQLPGRLGHGRARVGRPSAQRARDRRPGAGDRRPSQRLRVQRLPHERRRAAAAVVDWSPTRKLEPFDVWAWGQIGEVGSALTGYPVHSVFEDFTWDQRHTMSGAADDWVYEHLGVFGWTTEFWDIVQQRHRAQAVDPLLVHRPHRRRSAGGPALVRRAPPGRSRRLVPVRPSPARRGRARRLERPLDVDQSAVRHAARRGRPPRRLRHPSGAVLAAARDRCTPPSTRSATTRGGSRPGSPTPAGWRPTSAPSPATTSLVKPGYAELTGAGVVVGGTARQPLGHLDGQGGAAVRRRHTTARPIGPC